MKTIIDKEHYTKWYYTWIATKKYTVIKETMLNGNKVEIEYKKRDIDHK